MQFPINFSTKVNWTRISEYKHSPNQPAGVRDYPGTVVSIVSITLLIIKIIIYIKIGITNKYNVNLNFESCQSTG